MNANFMSQPGTMTRLQEARVWIAGNILPMLPEPPTGAALFEICCPYNPIGTWPDIEDVRASAIAEYNDLRKTRGHVHLTELQQVVVPDLGVIYLWFHTVPPRRKH